MTSARAGRALLDTDGRRTRVWVYDASTRIERDVMEMAPELGPDGADYYRVPVVLLHGVAHAGTDPDTGRDRFVPTVVRVYGKLPYMYVAAPKAWQNDAGTPPSAADLECVAQRLDDAIWDKQKQPYRGRKLQDDAPDTTKKVARKDIIRQKGLGPSGGGGRQSALSFVAAVANSASGRSEASTEEPASSALPPLPPRTTADDVQLLQEAWADVQAAAGGTYTDLQGDENLVDGLAELAKERLVAEQEDIVADAVCALELEIIDGDKKTGTKRAREMIVGVQTLKVEHAAAIRDWRKQADEWVAQRDAVRPVSSSSADPDPLASVAGDDPSPGETYTRRRIPYVHSVEYVHKPTTKHYGKAQSFLKVTLTAPNLVTTLRTLLWTPVSSESTPTHTVRQEAKRPPVISFTDTGGRRHVLPQDDLAECKVEFYMRYLIDQNLDMAAWLELDGAVHMDSELCEGNVSTAFLAVRHDSVHTLDEKTEKMPAPEFLEVGMDIETRNTVIWGEEKYANEAGVEKRRRIVRGAKFPNAAVPDNSIQCICIAVHPNGEALSAASEERRRCLAEGLRWEDQKGDRKKILDRQRKAELTGGWYEVFCWGRVNEQRVTERRSEKPVYFHQASDEFTMLRQFRNRMAALRAELPLTWNGNAFDVPYISDRLELHYKKRSHEVFNVADMVGATSDWAASRETWAAKEARFQSKQAGKRGGRDIQWPGMPWIDVMQTVIKNYKFRSYKLDSVAEHFLGEHKDDMDPAQITPTWDRDEDGAADVVAYCCWDAELPWRISQVNRLTEDLLQMARVTKVPPQALLTRGQSIKSYVQILIHAAKSGFLVHHHEAPPSAFDAKRTEAKYKGAVVIEPKKGFYGKRPIIVLDFAALYPSEAISHNLCYTTWVPPHILHLVPEDDRFQTPAGHWFVKPSVRRGMVPEVLKALLGARKSTRSLATAAENEGDIATATSLDKRQLNYKVSANSIYGFMGSDASLPCFAVSESITAYGREDIMAVKALIEATYPGFEIIYGDTDSVMIASPEDVAGDAAIARVAAARDGKAALNTLLADTPEYAAAFARLHDDDTPHKQALLNALNKDGAESAARAIVEMAQRVRAIALMHEMAALVNERFRSDEESVMSITAEKIYLNYLLMSKKRYSGMFYTRPEAPDKHDSKGLENVRRDFAPITSEAVDGVLKRIVRDGSVAAAAEYARAVIGDLVSRRTPFEKLVISKKLSRAAEDYATPQPHIYANKAVARRDPGREKLEGDRVEYVITAGRAMCYARAEDPRFVLDNNVPIDYDYYWTKQLKEPLHRLFKRVMPEEQIQSEIFNGPHMRKRAAAPVRKDAGGIGRFVVATKRAYADDPVVEPSPESDAAPRPKLQARITLTENAARPTLHNDASCLGRFVRPLATTEERVSAQAAAFASVPVPSAPLGTRRHRPSKTAARRAPVRGTKRTFNRESLLSVELYPLPPSHHHENTFDDTPDSKRPFTRDSLLSVELYPLPPSHHHHESPFDDICPPSAQRLSRDPPPAQRLSHDPPAPQRLSLDPTDESANMDWI